jgi:hypothetical protein
MPETLRYEKARVSVGNLTGGVNSKIHAVLLPDTQSADLQDIDISTPGLLQTRKGYTAIANNIDSGSTLRGLGYARLDDGTRNLLAWSVATASTAGLYKWTGSGNWSLVGSAVTSFLSASDVYFQQYRDQVYMGQDIDGQTRVLTSTLSATPTEEGNTTTSGNTAFPVTSSFSWWLGRLWAFNNRTSMTTPYGTAVTPAYLWFSNALTATGPTVWDRTNQVFAMGFGTGQDARAIQPIRSGELIVFLNASIERLRPTSSDIFGISSLGFPAVANFQRDIIDPLIGCGARKTVQILGSDILFMDQYGNIRSLARTALDSQQGTKSLPLSDPINDPDIVTGGINNLNQAQITKCAAAVFGNKYYISFPATVDSTSNDKTYVYDVTLGSWTGPWNYGFSQFVVSDVVTEGVWKLYGIKDVPPARVYEIESGTSDNATAIAYQETTKRYTFGDLDRQKIGRLIIVTCSTSDNANMTVEAAVDGSGYASLGTFNVGGSTETLPQSLPFDLGAGGGLVRGKFHLESLGRFHDIQFRFKMNTLNAAAKKLGHTIYATFENVRKED